MMNTFAQRTQENKSRSIENAISCKQRDGESAFQVVDNRLETIQMRKLQEMANNSFLMKQSSAFQEMASGTVVQKVAAKDHTDKISKEISSSALGRSVHKDILREIFEKLESENLSYKVGGSIAAKLLGARRSPNDLELEMPDMPSVSKGHEAINEIATTYKIQNSYVTIGNPVFGISIKFDGTINNDHTESAEPVRFEIDMIDENADEANTQLEKPQVMDIFSGNASREIDNVVERSRLIVNYADRSYNKPDKARLKQDYHQIHDLLETGNKNKILEEASHHGHARTSYDIKNMIRGQNKVSEFVESAEQNQWMKDGKVKENVEKAHLDAAKQKGWILDDNKVNTRYELPAWQP
jgi:hypothetical protein